MKIAIDARMISWTGIGRYTVNLLSQLQLIDTTNEYLIMLQSKDFDRWQPTAPNFQKIRADFEPYSLRGLFRFGMYLDKLRPDLVHFTSQNTPFFYRGLQVSTVHDLTLIDYKNIRGNKLLYEAKYQLFKRMVTNTITGSAKVIVPTKFGQQELLRRRYITNDSDVVVINESAEHLEAQPGSLDRFKAGSNFLLYVGNCYPYKNLLRLVDAFGLLARQSPDLNLVLVGKDDVFLAPIKKRIHELRLDARVILTGYVTDGELAAFYQQAKLFIFPSLAEGFGLPPLEAMVQGTPVISSNASCMPEVLGDAAAYFEPTNVQDMARQISALLSDQTRLDQLKIAGPRHAALFSAKRMAEETLAVYQAASTGRETRS